VTATVETGRRQRVCVGCGGAFYPVRGGNKPYAIPLAEVPSAGLGRAADEREQEQHADQSPPRRARLHDHR